MRVLVHFLNCVLVLHLWIQFALQSLFPLNHVRALKLLAASLELLVRVASHLGCPHILRNGIDDEVGLLVYDAHIVQELFDAFVSHIFAILVFIEEVLHLGEVNLWFRGRLQPIIVGVVPPAISRLLHIPKDHMC